MDRRRAVATTAVRRRFIAYIRVGVGLMVLVPVLLMLLLSCEAVQGHLCRS